MQKNLLKDKEKVDSKETMVQVLVDGIIGKHFAEMENNHHQSGYATQTIENVKTGFGHGHKTGIQRKGRIEKGEESEPCRYVPVNPLHNGHLQRTHPGKEIAKRIEACNRHKHKKDKKEPEIQRTPSRQHKEMGNEGCGIDCQ